MRRSQGGYSYQPLPSTSGSNVQGDMLEQDNDRMTEELREKIGVLKSLTIDIGNEVKMHDKLLRGMDDDADRTSGFLSSTMQRVVRLSKGGHRSHLCYLLLFCLAVFVVLWFVIAVR